VDLHAAKERIAIALVESIFCRAGYSVRRLVGDQPSSRWAAFEDFTPSFYLSGSDKQEFPVGVVYRPFLEPYLALENQRRKYSTFTMARRQWPGLQPVLATDHPSAGRSCFQALVAAAGGSDLRTMDLVDLPGLALGPADVIEHEELLRRMFTLLAGDGDQRTLVLATYFPVRK
jgi:hypothetical protein